MRVFTVNDGLNEIIRQNINIEKCRLKEKKKTKYDFIKMKLEMLWKKF